MGFQGFSAGGLFRCLTVIRVILMVSHAYNKWFMYPNYSNMFILNQVYNLQYSNGLEWWCRLTSNGMMSSLLQGTSFSVAYVWFTFFATRVQVEGILNLSQSESCPPAVSQNRNGQFQFGFSQDLLYIYMVTFHLIRMIVGERVWCLVMLALFWQGGVVHRLIFRLLWITPRCHFLSNASVPIVISLFMSRITLVRIVINFLPFYRVRAEGKTSLQVTLPSLKLTAPENRPSQKEMSSSNHQFSGTT